MADADEIAMLKYIAEKPGRYIPPIAIRTVNRLLRLRLVKRTALGLELDEGGVELLVHNGPAPTWVRDAIARAR